MPISTRLEGRIRRDFSELGSAAEVLRILDDLPDAAGYGAEMLGSERLQTAIVLLAQGTIRQLEAAVQLAKTDWRDVLVAAELADADWPARLDAELGPEAA
ncbi:hypothetical protein I2501_02180 [Streptacidiphilus sp. NEAU-YB345]|uniref:Uncharacterized protein n=2 Tax=Streptacidiphilus fuscans TaxID=2789292 RepID=A0A931FCU1_9ACTN|nr:hypothetical protein [Streptacidiphilus fuscans]